MRTVHFNQEPVVLGGQTHPSRQPKVRISPPITQNMLKQPKMQIFSDFAAAPRARSKHHQRASWAVQHFSFGRDGELRGDFHFWGR